MGDRGEGASTYFQGAEVLRGGTPVWATGPSPWTPGTDVKLNTGHMLASFTLASPLI